MKFSKLIESNRTKTNQHHYVYSGERNSKEIG